MTTHHSPFSRAVARLAVPLILVAAAHAARPSLRKIYDAHSWFELRQAVRTQRAPVFYRGAVAYAFAEDKTAERLLTRAIHDSPRSWEAGEARSLLIFLYVRQGRHHAALGVIDEALKFDPKSDPQDFRSMVAGLARVPDLSIERRAYSRVQGKIEDENLFVPLTINDKTVHWILDTGMNFSGVVSESEAKALGLTVVHANMQGMDSNGGQQMMNVATLSTLEMGNIRLHNVGMTVIPDSAPPMNLLPAGERGILGLPTIMQLGTLRWMRDGMVEAAFRTRRRGEPNLCLDGLNPLTRVVVEGRTLDFLFDTGNGGGTQLWRKFGEAFPDMLRDKGAKDTKTVRGIGGATESEVIALPELHLVVGGFDTLLKPAHVFGKPVGNDYYYGLLGMDLMIQAREATIDFSAMRVELKN
jgi:hypothetical protein